LANERTKQPSAGGLEALAREIGKNSAPPVHLWNPPYCGDIGLEIRANGTWAYRGSPITRPALVKLFASVLRRDEDGRHYLVTPVEKIDVAVADAPFIAVEMEASGEGRGQTLTFRTNTEDVVICGPDHPIRFADETGDGGFKPYILVRGRLEALVARALCYDLADLASMGPGDESATGVWSEGTFFPFGGAASG
jgi:uncharacterized protein